MFKKLDRYQPLAGRRIKSIKNLIKNFYDRVSFFAYLKRRFTMVYAFFSSVAHRRNGIVPSNLVSRRS